MKYKILVDIMVLLTAMVISGCIIVLLATVLISGCVDEEERNTIITSIMTGHVYEDRGITLIDENKLRNMTIGEMYEEGYKINEIKTNDEIEYIEINDRKFSVFKGNTVSLIPIPDDKEERVLETRIYIHDIHDSDILVGDTLVYTEVRTCGYVFLHNNTIERLIVFNDEHCR